MRRVAGAAALLAVALAGLLVAWFVSGWAEVRGRQRAVRDEPAGVARARGEALAHDLRGELARLLSREVERPYFHYQNLFHDPRASQGLGVTPSPLARRPEDPLVLGYFQVDGAGKVTTPALNDDVPEASDAANLGEHRRFRDLVARSFARALPVPAKRAKPVAAAVAQPRRVKVVPQAPVAVKPAPVEAAKPEQELPQQLATNVVKIDRNSYAQNQMSNSLFVEQRAQPPPPPPVAPAPVAKKPPRPTAPPPPPPPAPESVAILVSPLEWRTLALGAQPALVAVRQVDTPDGGLAQGFVLDRSALTSWLAGHAGDAVAELRTGDDGSTEIAPGWHLEVAPNPHAVAAAAAVAADIARGFLGRFVGVGALALIMAVLVIVLVARAERLARERSQFAAAAAHELRTPLAGLQLYGDMLADGLGDPSKLRDYARRMSEEASRLGRVVSNVLGFSQLERGNLSVEPVAASLADALRALAERAEPALDRAGAVLALDVPPELTARFDRDALARIVGNLLDNAEKYSRASGDRTITLAARAAGERVEVSVSDHGPGLAPGVALFRPFTRGVTQDGPAGLGLGLALSRSLARAMGGELSVRSAGGGATFVLALPL